MCGNYKDCREVNEKALELKADDAYAMKGYAIAIFKLGDKTEGVKYLRQAADLTGWKDQDILEDLRAMEQTLVGV